MKFYQKILVKTANLFYSCKVFGKENIPEESAVICCNHLSAIDVLYLVNHFNKNTFFVAKKELFQKKFSGSFLSSFGGIPIDRDNVDVSALMNIIRMLKSGKNMVIFPEGTRNKTGTTELLPFKAGSVVLAMKTKKKVLPVIIYRKAKFLRKNYMIIGKPFDLNEFYEKTITDENVVRMENYVRDKMMELQKELFDKLNKKSKRRKAN